MKRRVILVLLLLAWAVAGAIVNVAVAWGSALWSGGSIELTGVRVVEPSVEDVAWWASHMPDKEARQLTFLSRDRHCYQSTAFGLDARNVALLPGYEVASTAAGWPFRTAYATRVLARGVQHETGVFHASWMPYREDPYWLPLYGRFLPLVPIWPGFAINTVFYAVVLWLLFAAPVALRRRRRIKRGLCPKCAYPVGTWGAERCTECGARHEAKP